MDSKLNLKPFNKPNLKSKSFLLNVVPVAAAVLVALLVLLVAAPAKHRRQVEAPDGGQANSSLAQSYIQFISSSTG